mmetsp:Transcript_13461/g.16025  ORF Transcript_13461/g.16025 Transcript_13461/m.16025 type:complete len:175 (-) Transcript_13461:234-758(-)
MASTLTGGDRLPSEFGLFDDQDIDTKEDKMKAGYVDEWASLFDLPLDQHDTKSEEVEPLQQHSVVVVKQSRTLSLLIPSIPTSNHQQVTNNNNSIEQNNDNVIKTRKDMKRQYRQNVAIPRYLAKRKRRNWEKQLMHPSRSVAAQRRPRNGGQFGVVDARFTPCESKSMHIPSL